MIQIPPFHKTGDVISLWFRNPSYLSSGLNVQTSSKSFGVEIDATTRRDFFFIVESFFFSRLDLNVPPLFDDDVVIILRIDQLLAAK